MEEANKKFQKELSHYIANFDTDKENVDRLVSFSKDAIRFIIEKELYPEFLKFQADKAKKDL